MSRAKGSGLKLKPDRGRSEWGFLTTLWYAEIVLGKKLL